MELLEISWFVLVWKNVTEVVYATGFVAQEESELHLFCLRNITPWTQTIHQEVI